MVARDQKSQEMGNDCLTVTGFFLGDENVVELDQGDRGTVLRMY